MITPAKSDFDEYDRLQLPQERLYGSASVSNKDHFISLAHSKPVESSYSGDETLQGEFWKILGWTFQAEKKIEGEKF